jgi:hypothetical protein
MEAGGRIKVAATSPVNIEMPWEPSSLKNTIARHAVSVLNEKTA